MPKNRFRQIPMFKDDPEDEMPKEIMLHEIEAKCREIGHLIGGEMPAGVGFCFMMFTFGEGGWSTYVANAERESMMIALEEFIEKMRSHE